MKNYNRRDFLKLTGTAASSRKNPGEKCGTGKSKNPRWEKYILEEISLRI
jgi:hypothetical protein